MTTAKATRRQALARTLTGAAAAAAAAIPWGLLSRRAAMASPFVLRPPGAMSESKFVGRCIKCGQCVAACPYGTLGLAAPGDPYPVGTPHFHPRKLPCYMCPDIPCVGACPTGALSSKLTDIHDAGMGLAVLVDQDNCLSYQGLRCEICHRACPVSGRAITIDTKPRRTSKHAVFAVKVHADACTGCGMCEKSCPLPEAAIKVLPFDLAQGAAAGHYRMPDGSTVPLTERFVPERREADPEPERGASPLDYLNSGAP